MANKIQFNGRNLNEVRNFLGDKLMKTVTIEGQTVIQFTHAGGYPVVADIWDVFTKGESGDIYLESRITKFG